MQSIRVDVVIHCRRVVLFKIEDEEKKTKTNIQMKKQRRKENEFSHSLANIERMDIRRVLFNRFITQSREREREKTKQIDVLNQNCRRH